jgi:hypothetical protein
MGPNDLYQPEITNAAGESDANKCEKALDALAGGENPDGVVKVGRTKALLLAALRLWELKRGIYD